MANNKGHHFRITVEKIDAPPRVNDPAPTLTFEARNHDDILIIAESIGAGTSLPTHDANALAIGLKLFTEVMLTYRQDSLFAEIQPAMRTFIGTLKSRISSMTSGK